MDMDMTVDVAVIITAADRIGSIHSFIHPLVVPLSFTPAMLQYMLLMLTSSSS